MKEAVVDPEVSVTIKDVPVPVPGEGEVLIRVVAYGLNPKDWKYPVWRKTTYNPGDDCAGIVSAVGPGVFEFREGDRVAGYHQYKKPNGTFAEYTIAPAYACVRIPDSTTFEEAATIPLAALTAAVGLFHTLGLPSPWQLPDAKEEEEGNTHPQPITKTPLVIYGLSTAVGAFAVKLARQARIHPIIAVGSPTSRVFADEYLDPAHGDALVDYTAHESPAAIAAAIREALIKGGAAFGRAYHALDCVGEKGSFEDVLAAALGEGGDGPAIETKKRPLVASVLPPKMDSKNGVDAVMTFVGWCHDGTWSGKTFASIWLNLMASGLVEGWFKPHPHEVMPNGLNGLEDSLKRLRDGKVRAIKLVGRIHETPGI